MSNRNLIQDVEESARRTVERLAVDEQHDLAAAALALGDIRQRTINDQHYRTIWPIIYDLAPTLAIELDRLIKYTDNLNNKRGNPT